MKPALKNFRKALRVFSLRTTNYPSMDSGSRAESRDELRTNAGITLVEAVIYIALLGLLLLFTVGTVRSMIVSLAEIRTARAINNSASFALERMVRSIREARDIDESGSVLGTSYGTLKITGATTTTFNVSAGTTLRITENSNTPQPLTASDVKVSSLIFREVLATSSQAVKIELSIQNKKGHDIRTAKFYATAVLRGSYK